MITRDVCHTHGIVEGAARLTLFIPGLNAEALRRIW